MDERGADLLMSENRDLHKRVNTLMEELNKFKGTFDYWECSWCGEQFKKSNGVDKPAFHIVECRSNPLLIRAEKSEAALAIVLTTVREAVKKHEQFIREEDHSVTAADEELWKILKEVEK